MLNSVTQAALVIADVYALQSALPPRFQEGASWCAHLAILNLLRQMQTANGSLIFPSLQNDPPTLLGRPVQELSNMWPTITGGTHNLYMLLYRGFSAVRDRGPLAEPVASY